jgi:cyclophilin family peptidyl-prolyl cis-trans isomerase
MPNVSPARQICGRACLWALTALSLLTASTGAQQAAARPSLSPADSALIYAVLTAEERRDAGAEALRTGAVHPDARVRAISARALARITDSRFAARDSLGRPNDRPMPSWALPEWAERFRILSARTVSCDTLFRAVTDSAIQVRLRAIGLAGNQAACRTHTPMLASLRKFVAEMPANTIARQGRNGSWHEGAAALVSYAMLAPDSALPFIPRYARHQMPQVRRAAARAAVVTRDTALLSRLVRDDDANVAEAAIQGLARVAAHAYDSVYMAHLASARPQVALAAAVALNGSSHPQAAASARRAFTAVAARDIASERDVRSALRRILGDSTPEPWLLRQKAPLPQEVVALALGEPRYIQVVSSRLHGGASFTVELRGDVAPIMAARVLARVRENRYDGQRWHRVEPGFVIQGGSPLDNEYSGSAFFWVDELGTVPHPRGSVGMSTRGHDTGDAQWFINLRDNARLTADYTVFAVVIEGMDVVDRVLEGDEFYVMREVSAPPRSSRP